MATVFPILFASNVGRFTSEVARWKLESGLTLGSLEQLLGSRTVGSVLTTQFQLKTFNVLGISLILVWTFSPLGTQAILRSLNSRLEPRESTSIITYYDNLEQTGLASIGANSPGSEEGSETYFQYLKYLFLSTLLTPETTKLDPMDQWGNVKIPFLPIADHGNQQSDNSWQSMSYSQTTENYVSLAGIPVTNVPFGNATILVESTYLELDCHNVTRHYQGRSKPIQWDWGFASGSGPSENTTIPKNGTWQGYTWDSSNPMNDEKSTWSLALDNFVDWYWVNETEQRERLGPNTTSSLGCESAPMRFVGEQGIKVQPTQLLFQTELKDSALTPGNTMVAVCNVHQRYAESRVLCERDDASSRSRHCSVTEQRPSQRPHATELISHLNFPRPWAWLTRKLPQVGSNGNSGSSVRADIVVQYLADPKLTNMTVTDIDMFDRVENAAFSRRLSQILNTYLLLIQVYLSTPEGSTGGSQLKHNITAAASTTILVEVYSVSRGWVVACGISCGVVLIGGLLSTIFRHKAISPDILGFASTVIRDSRYVDLPLGFDRMSGTGITKELIRQKMRYGVTALTRGDQPLLGVGREEDILKLRE